MCVCGCKHRCVCIYVYVYMYMVPPMYLHIFQSNGTWTLKTIVLARKTMNNYVLTTKILQQPTQQKHGFKPRRNLKTRNSLFFFVPWFRGSYHQPTVKITKSHKPGNKNTKTIAKNMENRKRSVHIIPQIKNSWFFLFFPMFWWSGI